MKPGGFKGGAILQKAHCFYLSRTYQTAL